MKKNFMAIASLLIAAMLLVVSCSQESVVPENNGLVEAKLSVGYGRNISVTGNTDAEGLSLQYKMTPKWTDDPNESDSITNPASDYTALPSGGNIGWITPGQWLIEVKASKDSKTVFTGSITAYFSKNSTQATVYLAPVSNTTNCSIDITVSMQEIKEKVQETNETGETSYVEKSYKLQYEILSQTGGTIESKKDMGITASSSDTNKIVTYSASKTGLSAGFYTVTVYVIDAEGATVGGIRKGFLLADGDNAKLTGHIEPADYSNVTINAVYIDVNVNLTAGTITKNNDNKYEFTVSASDTTSNPPTGFSKSYIWYVDGVQKAQENILSSSKTFTFDNPGYKNIACQAVYSINVGGTIYYFTDTASIYQLVNPTT